MSKLAEPALSSKGFTLIELLVVMSIIGTLSVTILVALSNVRDKGRITKGIAFSSSIEHSSFPTIKWDFDESSGNNVPDSSGFGNNGNIQGVVNWQNDVASPNKTKSLLLNGSTNVYISDSSKFNTTSRKGFTLSIWIKPQDLSSGYKILMSRQTVPYIGLSTNGSNAQAIFTILDDKNGDGCSQVAFNPDYQILWSTNSPITVGKWFHIAGVVDSTGNASIYIDGKLDHSSSGYTHSCNYVNASGGFTVGSWASGYYFNGYVDEARYYNGALTASNIQQIYAQGKN